MTYNRGRRKRLPRKRGIGWAKFSADVAILEYLTIECRNMVESKDTGSAGKKYRHLVWPALDLLMLGPARLIRMIQLASTTQFSSEQDIELLKMKCFRSGNAMWPKHAVHNSSGSTWVMRRIHVRTLTSKHAMNDARELKTISKVSSFRPVWSLPILENSNDQW